MRLLQAHPEVAFRDCADCARFVYQPDGRRAERRGLPVERPKGTVPPCHACPKTEGQRPRVRAAAVDLSDRNRAAYWHDRQCRAVGEWPADPIVRRNAAVIREVEDSAERDRRAVALLAVANLLG